MSLKEKLEIYAKHNLNVMLIGSHGIGKSTIAKSIAEKLNLKFKYYSTSTLDPFADLVGIPSPDKETDTLKFYRPKDIQEAEFIMFDELNRAHPRVLNAILEIVQFKSVNGISLSKLKMVWAAINPPNGDYQVEELDPALVDRFHQFVKLDARIDLEYLNTKIKPEISVMLKNWWETFSDEQKRFFTPRRIEYLGMMIQNDIPWRDCIPQCQILFPTEDLQKRINIINGKDDEDFIIDAHSVLTKKSILLEKMKEDAKYSIPISAIMKSFTEKEWFDCRDLLEQLPRELLKNVVENRFSTRKRLLKELFINNKIDFVKYPKIVDICGFNSDE